MSASAKEAPSAGADAIALDPLEHRGETGPGIDRVGTADGRVIEGIDDREVSLTGKRLDRLSLPFLAVLVGPDIGR